MFAVPHRMLPRRARRGHITQCIPRQEVHDYAQGHSAGASLARRAEIIGEIGIFNLKVSVSNIREGNGAKLPHTPFLLLASFLPSCRCDAIMVLDLMTLDSVRYRYPCCAILVDINVVLRASLWICEGQVPRPSADVPKLPSPRAGRQRQRQRENPLAHLKHDHGSKYHQEFDDYQRQNIHLFTCERTKRRNLLC